MSNIPPPIKPMRKLPADSRVLADELKPILDGLERGRQQALAKIRQGWKRIGLTALITVGVTVAILAIITTVTGPNDGPQVFALCPVVIGVVICIITYTSYISGHSQAYEAVYKEKVIGGMTRLLQPGMSFSPARGISEESFRATGLYSSSIDRYSCEDLFAGKIDKTGLMFSELHAEERRTRTDSKGRSETYWVTIFQGLVFIADFNKNFRSWLTIKPDFAESSFGWLGRKIQSFNSDLVRLENPDFERAFVVHGGDQVEARYILTPDLQERLLKLRAAYGDDIRMSLHASRFHLSIPKSEDWFEPSMNLPAHDLSQMQTFVNQMSWIFGIVELLDLNTRIWSKV
ncbi:DUF3137 domain-containing protein [Oceaniferula spumae]